MKQSTPRAVLNKVLKLRQIADALRAGGSFPVTRLTVLKSLCAEATVARHFALYLALKALEHAEKGQRRSSPLPPEQDRLHRQLMAEAIREMKSWTDNPPEEKRRTLLELLGRIQAEQNEQKPIAWGSVRLIRDWELLIVEKALRAVLSPRETGYWVYQMARDYAERYDARHGDGLVPASAPLVQDIADFWADVEEDVSTDQGTADKRPGSVRRQRALSHAGVRKGTAGPPAFTHRQGQFLAFIHLYRKLHRQGPAEQDLVAYFRVTPPSVHGMVVKLEERGLITREAGVARSVKLSVPEDVLPELEDVTGPPW